ncbi:MAG: hypothetical protein QOG59_2936, partial [Solirubrobacteraceae bacterium]|nr:hypothetical protein [Solirubrobacteraceae bacterium]
MISLGRRLCLAGALLCLLPASASAVSSPVIAGSVSDAVNLSATTSVAVSGHYAYATAYHAGELTAVDIS